MHGVEVISLSEDLRELFHPIAIRIEQNDFDLAHGVVGTGEVIENLLIILGRRIDDDQLVTDVFGHRRENIEVKERLGRHIGGAIRFGQFVPLGRMQRVVAFRSVVSAAIGECSIDGHADRRGTEHDPRFQPHQQGRLLIDGSVSVGHTFIRAGGPG
ncbi:hypothetical protein Pan189_02680 [Stratiformator vulcanicus]|uniref:Uncharacterized protein n=1 Tax=Stratiformator vulcanicus TaxID=2527980 RepID=A0A517QW73_9PLAN|nr:hypothetical protein Pan189_02680 [Stratiformator vulcanicus]